MNIPPEITNNKPLHIEILQCSGGEGHHKATESVKKALENHFGQGNISFTEKDVGSHLAPNVFGKLTFNKCSSIDFHNMCARNGWIRTIKILAKIGQFIHKYHSPACKKWCDKHFNKLEKKGKSPDLVVSVVPYINAPLLKSAKGRNIPVLVISTDADNALFSSNWPKDKDLGPHRYAIPYNAYEIAEKVNKAVDPSKIRGIGYPVSSDFLTTYSQKQIDGFREELGVEKNKKVVSVMMGGLGGVVTEKYTKNILQAIKNGKLENAGTHFNILCGKNEFMADRLKKMAEKFGFTVEDGSKAEGIKLTHTSGASLTVVKYTANVYKYMAMSRCLVTKPGSSTFNECLYMGLPMLLDNTKPTLPWEALNVDLAETYNFGERVTNFDQFIGQLNDIIGDDKYEKHHQAMLEYLEDRPNQKKFSDNVAHITQELLTEADNKKTENKVDSSKEKENLGGKIKRIGLNVLKTVKKIFVLAIKILLFPIKWLMENIIDYAFYSSCDLKGKVRNNRRTDLILGNRTDKQGNTYTCPHKAKPIEGLDSPMMSPVSKRPIDALHIRSNSPNRTGNTVIYVLAKQYQNFHPKNFDHILDDGGDVILFNPTKNNAKVHSEDLKELIKELKRRNPEQKILLHGYCIGAHIAVSVASDIADGNVSGLKTESLPVIVDRGYGNGYEIAKNLTFAARFSPAKSYINKNYNHKTFDNIKKHTGGMLFLSPQQGRDQLNHQKNRNFTRELHDKHLSGVNKWIELQNADHWTPWTYEVHNEVKGFLSDQEIIKKDFRKFEKNNPEGFPEKTKVSRFNRQILPLIFAPLRL